MKKYLGIVCSLVMVLSLGLVTALPVTAAEPATLLSATGEWVVDPLKANEDRIIVEVPAETTLGQITSIAWSEYLIQGYPPHVDIMLDLDKNGTADEALVFEYAFNDPINDISPTYGALTGAWYQTFSDGSGPAVIDGDASAWLATGVCGATIGTLTEWQAGLVVPEINADTIVLRLEIEVDNWMVDTVALVDNIEVVIDGKVYLGTTVLEDVVSISLSTYNIDFGSVYPGDTANAELTIYNEGTVRVDLTAETTSTFYTLNLLMDGSSPVLEGGWSDSIAEGAAGLEVPLALTVPHGTSAGVQTGLLIIWVERSEDQS